MTKAMEQRTNDLYSSQSSAGVTSLSSNVGSISDFLFPSTHSTSASISFNPETSLPTSNNISGTEDIDQDTPGELNLSMNKEKLGHRRVDEIGNVTYKRVMIDELIKSLQIGLNHAIEHYDPPQRSILLQDFQETDYQDFPPEGSNSTPKHPYAEFRLKTYAPNAFRFFRNAFGVDPSAFLSSLCERDLRELPNPGASGSIFYLTADDVYIIKTVSKREARFLLSLLPACSDNLTKNPFTLLPKFFGLFCYQSANKNIRFVIMNNLVPTNVRLHEKYDLKGSIYKRKASEEEQKRELPTLKDNDFKLLHPNGLILEPFVYDQLVKTIDDDVRILRSFGIMDYSLLLAVHNITEEMKANQILPLLPTLASSDRLSADHLPTSTSTHEETTTVSEDSGITMASISNLPTYMQYLRVVEFVRAQQESSLISIDPSVLSEQLENAETASIETVQPDPSPSIDSLRETSIPASEEVPPSSFPSSGAVIGGNIWYNRQNLSRLTMAGIPAVNSTGDLLLLYVGVIDILQNYRLRKKLEHAFKSTLVTREEISVCNPNHYGDRFVRFLSRRVFRKGGTQENGLYSDSHSNTNRITVYSNRSFNPSSSHRSHISGDDASSIVNNSNISRPPM